MMKIDEYIETHCGGDMKEFDRRFDFDSADLLLELMSGSEFRIGSINDKEVILKVYATRQGQ